MNAPEWGDLDWDKKPEFPRCDDLLHRDVEIAADALVLKRDWLLLQAVGALERLAGDDARGRAEA
jgi:hypothetical protein